MRAQLARTCGGAWTTNRPAECVFLRVGPVGFLFLGGACCHSLEPSCGGGRKPNRCGSVAPHHLPIPEPLPPHPVHALPNPKAHSSVKAVGSKKLTPPRGSECGITITQITWQAFAGPYPAAV